MTKFATTMQGRGWDALAAQFGATVDYEHTYRGAAAVDEAIVVLDQGRERGIGDPQTERWAPVANPALVTATLTAGGEIVEADGSRWRIEDVQVLSSGLARLWCVAAEDVT